MNEQNSRETLKDFIYIDKERMYSLYSQLFKGVVESMVESVSYASKDAQKEKKLEETIIDASVKVQNVVLFDHIYNTLEDKLNPNLCVIDDNTTLDTIKPSTFIKVSGYVVIEDYDHLTNIMKKYNDIGLAFATIEAKNPTHQNKNLSNNTIEQDAKSKGLILDKKYTESVVKILETFKGNSMEITFEKKIGTHTVYFKSLIDEKHLRLTPSSMRSLYGYKPCMKWTLVGEITNIPNGSYSRIHNHNGLFADMFKSLDNLDSSFSTMNTSFCNIFQVAPIAIYIDHTLE